MFKRLFIAILLLFVTSLASAQLFDSIGGTLKDADIGGSLGGTPPAAPADTSSLIYTPDPAVSAEVLQLFIENLSSSGQATPEQIAQFEEVAKTELTRENMQLFIDQLFVGEGFKLDNIADVFAMYLIASFAVLNDMTNGTTTEQDLIVRDQVVAAFASVPEMQQLSDKDKQTFAEALLLSIIFLANDWQQALQGVEGYDLETVKGYTRDTLVQMGIDPAQFDFTPQGLIRKGQSSGQTTTPQQTPQTTTPTTTPQTATTVSPEIQAQVDAMTPEELQEMVPQCEQLVANPDATSQLENGAMALQMCQAIIAKSGGTAPTTNTQTPTTQTPDTQQPDNQNNPLEGSTPANPLGGTADPFVGSFSGDNLILTLQGANNAYTGELNFNGQPFPVQATANGTNLTGTFTSGSSTFNFTATLQDTALTLVSDGSTFNLTKQ